jgi:prolyl-tRNA editing enzyme YbaK/EbsC (Cys-tRNA(Pro) deacylase)
VIEDFLSANKLDAEFFSFDGAVSIKKALFETQTQFSSVAKAEFYVNNSGEEFLFVFPFNSKLELSKLKQLTKSSELVSPDPEVTLDATGYAKGFLPPVSIYGVKVFLDKSLENKNYLFFQVGENSFLKISPDSIIEANEDSSIAIISK